MREELSSYCAVENNSLKQTKHQLQLDQIRQVLSHSGGGGGWGTFCIGLEFISKR